MSSLPAGLLLFDTGIYIRFSRGKKYLWLGEDARIFQRTIFDRCGGRRTLHIGTRVVKLVSAERVGART